MNLNQMNKPMTIEIAESESLPQPYSIFDPTIYFDKKTKEVYQPNENRTPKGVVIKAMQETIDALENVGAKPIEVGGYLFFYNEWNHEGDKVRIVMPFSMKRAVYIGYSFAFINFEERLIYSAYNGKPQFNDRLKAIKALQAYTDLSRRSGVNTDKWRMVMLRNPR